MIEIPSAAVIADLLASEVDFFSIGTNDLIQYTLAVDRDNEQIADLYQPSHPAVLRTLRHVIETGRKYDVGVTICGEMAGDPLFTQLLLGMGLREFSCSAGSIPEIKRLIRSTTMADARRIASGALRLRCAKEIRAFLADATRAINGGSQLAGCCVT
jgi:phosphotransferase system enzyme I (PtsI)